jgi:phage gp29-like protein
MQGFDFTQPPFNQYMIGVGREDDLGLYEKAALLYILKKHSWQSWDEFEERFGIPIPIVETATTDTKVLNTIEKWLRDLSTGSYGVIPDGGKLTVVETGKADAHQVFFKKIEMAQMELEVLFTGQIRETNKSGTYGKEQAKEDEAQELIADDKTFIANLINDQLIPNILIPNGYPLVEGDRFDWNDGAKATPKERLEIFKGVKELGFKLDLKQVSEELDVIIEEIEETEQDDPLKPGAKDNPKNLIPEAIVSMHAKINELYHVH